MDRTRVALFVLDADFRVVCMSPAIERFFGLRQEDVIGRDKAALIRERISGIFEDAVTFADKVLATYADNTYVENFECRVLPNGEREDRWLEHWSQPVSSGPCAGGRIEFYSDITDRVKIRPIEHKVQVKISGLSDCELLGLCSVLPPGPGGRNPDHP